MNYTPNELENIKLPHGVKGYKADAVDEMIVKIVEDYTAQITEIAELKDKIELLNEGVKHYKNLEESIKNTLVLAQQTSDEVKKASHQKAENIVKEARIKAKEVLEDSGNKALSSKMEYEELRKSLYTYKAKSTALLRSQLELIEKITGEE